MKALLIALAVLLAEDAGVDPRLWCNVVREESGWNVDAVSPSG